MNFVLPYLPTELVPNSTIHGPDRTRQDRVRAVGPVWWNLVITERAHVVCCVASGGGAARSSDLDAVRPHVDGGRQSAAAGRRWSTSVQQVLGCVAGVALALTLLAATAVVLCRRRRRALRRAAVTKPSATGASADECAVRLSRGKKRHEMVPANRR